MGVDLFRGRNERICVLCGSNTMMYEESPPTTTGDVDGDVDGDSNSDNDNDGENDEQNEKEAN